MVYEKATRDDHLFQVAVAQRVEELPGDTEQYDRRLNVAILEELGLRHSLHERDADC